MRFLNHVARESFDFGDSNRDLHILQVTRGAESRIVMVPTWLPESDSKAEGIKADLEIQLQVPPHVGFQNRTAFTLADASEKQDSVRVDRIGRPQGRPQVDMLYT